MARIQSMRIVIAYRVQAENPSLHIRPNIRRDVYIHGTLDIVAQLLHNSAGRTAATLTKPQRGFLHGLQFPDDLGFRRCPAEVILLLSEHAMKPVSCVAEGGVDPALGLRDEFTQSNRQSAWIDCAPELDPYACAPSGRRHASQFERCHDLLAAGDCLQCSITTSIQGRSLS